MARHWFPSCRSSCLLRSRASLRCILPRSCAADWRPLTSTSSTTAHPKLSPRPPDATATATGSPLPTTAKLTETLHSRKRVFDLAARGSSRLTFAWHDPPDTQSAKTPLHSMGALVPHPIRSWFRQTFLPIGSVHPSYIRVHIFQFVETFMWSSVTVLCSQSMLVSAASSPMTSGR
ncbi:hypothetical protein BC830DRAFT_441262 [Chytriomyces sp. MP71]|nr:hypothetical protein BC830DRAFT_441262 [Chytriomyces sp. MP71]